jgi:hypothetical protein
MAVRAMMRRLQDLRAVDERRVCVQKSGWTRARGARGEKNPSGPRRHFFTVNPFPNPRVQYHMEFETGKMHTFPKPIPQPARSIPHGIRSTL